MTSARASRPHERRSRGLVVASVLCLFAWPALARCNIGPDTLRGAWQSIRGEGFFEQMEFATEGNANVFNSWLHDRPEVAGGSWVLADCVIKVSGSPGSGLSYVFSGTMSGSGRLVLREAGSGPATYKRIK